MAEHGTGLLVSPLRRRYLRHIAMLLALGAAPLVRGQGRGKGLPLIGFLHAASRESVGYRLEAFTAELASLGWNVGSNVLLEARWADNRVDRLAELARDLVARSPALVVAAPAPAAKAVSQASAKVPIVMVGGSPVEMGLAKSLARPGGLVTGLLTNSEVDSKYLELLKQAIPSLFRAGFLLDGSTTRFAAEGQPTDSREAVYAMARKPDDLPQAFESLAARGAQALVILPSTWFTGDRKRIIAFANKRRWPIVASTSDWTSDGALISYGVDQAAVFRRAAHYADRILKGTLPGEIPIERPLQYELIVNKAAAKSLGVSVTQAMLLRADKVIE